MDTALKAETFFHLPYPDLTCEDSDQELIKPNNWCNVRMLDPIDYTNFDNLSKNSMKTLRLLLVNLAQIMNKHDDDPHLPNK